MCTAYIHNIKNKYDTLNGFHPNQCNLKCPHLTIIYNLVKIIYYYNKSKIYKLLYIEKI